MLDVLNYYWLQKLVELRPYKKCGSNEPLDLGDLWQPVLYWYGTNNMTRKFWNLVREKLWREKTIWSENDSAYIIFLANRYVCYMKKHQYYLCLKSYNYHIIFWKQKNKNPRKSRERNLNLGWCEILGFLIWRLMVEMPQL